MGSRRVACHPAEAASSALPYSIYPPIKDEKLSRPQPAQVNDLLGVTTEVPAIPGVS